MNQNTVKLQNRDCGIICKKRKQMIAMTLTPVKCPKCKETKVSKNGTENGV